MEAAIRKKVWEILGIAFFLGLFAAGTLFLDGVKAMRFSSKNDAVLVIPAGMSLQNIAALLKEKRVVSSAFYFEWMVRLFNRDSPLKAGEYALPEGLPFQELLLRLQQGRVLTHRLTIPEGLMSSEITALLLTDNKLEGDIDVLPPEGTLLPETYHYHRPQSRQALLGRMRVAQQELLNELWPKRKEGLPLTTQEEAIILASIVERETSLESERRHIAGVFSNRLKKGMPLQSDPTVRYGLYQQAGKPFEGPLMRDHLKHETPYNTYEISGLPPSPICHPGRASLEAVLTPLETEDLYFVADGVGGHHFSKTYREHQQHHQNWRKIRRRRRQE